MSELPSDLEGLFSRGSSKNIKSRSLAEVKNTLAFKSGGNVIYITVINIDKPSPINLRS